MVGATPPAVGRSHRSDGGGATSWPRAVGIAAVMLVASYLLYVLIPNNLLTYLSTRTSPRNRDLLVSLWWLAALGFGCWLFVRLQRTREG